MSTPQTGTELFKLAIPHQGEKYVLGTLVPKAYPNYDGPWDCAELASYLVYQLTGKLYGCGNDAGNPNGADAYSGYWVRDAAKLGRKISVEEAAVTRGAILVRVASSDITGHVVLCDGVGGTIEAHSTKAGVIASTVHGRRWDFGVLVPWIDYTKTAAPVPVKKPGVIYRWKTPIMHDKKVGEIQRALGFQGKAVDDYYGPRTFNAVRAFQRNQSLVADGEVGTLTATALGILL